MDNQVKVRGFRIETGEVEAALNQYPGVLDSVVVAHEFGPGDKRLVAYMVAGENPPATGDVRRFVGVKLPEYMVPSLIVNLPALPRLPNGKIDRRSLPAPDQGRSTREHVIAHAGHRAKAGGCDRRSTQHQASQHS